jgi:hypothetical protein
VQSHIETTDDVGFSVGLSGLSHSLPMGCMQTSLMFHVARLIAQIMQDVPNVPFLINFKFQMHVK